MDIHSFWNAVLTQNEEALSTFFSADAYVNWHCTNEHFTAQEFIRVNCDYPGAWEGTVERVETAGDLLVSVVHVYSKEHSLFFHVTSFIRVREGLICSMDEYWADDAPPPQWRQKLGLGIPLHP